MQTAVTMSRTILTLTPELKTRSPVSMIQK